MLLIFPPGWRCDFDARPEVVHVLRRALSWLALVEQPGNRGPDVERWLQEAHVEPGDPWCASWASSRDLWGELLPSGWPLASAYKLREWGANRGALVRRGRLLPCDLFVILDGFAGHVGIITADHGNGFCSTIEGNAGTPGAIRPEVRHGSEFAAIVRGVPVASPQFPNIIPA